MCQTSDLRSLLVKQRFERVDQFQVRRRRDVVVTFELEQEAIRQRLRRDVEVLAHVDTAAALVVRHLDLVEEARRHRLQRVFRPFLRMRTNVVYNMKAS